MSRSSQFGISSVAMLTVCVGLLVYLPISVYLEYSIQAGKVESERNSNLRRSAGLIKELYQSGYQQNAAALINTGKARGDIGYYALWRDNRLTKVDPPEEPLVIEFSYQSRRGLAGDVVADDKRTEINIILDKSTMLTIGRKQQLLTSWIDVIVKTGSWKMILVGYLFILGAFWSSFSKGFEDIRRLANDLLNSRYVH